MVEKIKLSYMYKVQAYIPFVCNRDFRLFVM